MAAVQEAMRNQNVVLVAADAGIETVDEEARRDALTGIDSLTAVRELSLLFSSLDLAQMIDWSEKQVQTDLLRRTAAPWSGVLTTRVDKGDHLLTAPALAQLMREILEYASPEPGAPELTLPTLVHYLLSINTEHHRHPEYSETGLVTDDDHWKIAQDFSGMSAEDTITKLRELMPTEIATMLAGITLSPILLRAEAEDTWFRPWPDKVIHPALGSCPADAFEAAHGVSLVEFLTLGKIIDDLAREGTAEFTRAQLLELGAPRLRLNCSSKRSRCLSISTEKPLPAIADVARYTSSATP